MLSIFWKEINSFFSSVIAYVVLGVFLIMTGLFLWVFQDTSILVYNYATMDSFFSIAPLLFLFLIPAVTMSSFAEEKARGTIEFLSTKPLTDSNIVLGKYFANVVLVIFSILPTLIYYYSIHELGSPKGNLDSGAIIGSYIGLFFLASAFVAIGMFASAMTDNQIVAFILGAFLCFFVHWAFSYLAALPIFIGNLDTLINYLGINSHYANISKGAIDSRDMIYFVSVIVFFIVCTLAVLENRKN